MKNEKWTRCRSANGTYCTIGHGHLVPRVARDQLAAQAGKAFAADVNDLGTDAQVEDVVERLMTDEADRGAGNQPEALPVAQAVGIVVLHLADNDTLADTKLMQGLQITLGKMAVRRRDRVPMGVFERFAEVGSQRLLQTRGNGVLEGVGLGIDLAPVQAQDARKK